MQISEDFNIGRTWDHPFGMVQASPYWQCIDGPRLKEKALHAAARLGIHGCGASTQPGIQDYVGRKCHCKSQNSDGLEEWRTAQNNQQIKAEGYI